MGTYSKDDKGRDRLYVKGVCYILLLLSWDLVTRTTRSTGVTLAKWKRSYLQHQQLRIFLRKLLHYFIHLRTRLCPFRPKVDERDPLEILR